MKRIMLYVVLGLLLFNCTSEKSEQNKFGQVEFEALLNTVSKGWNENNAAMAADCFAEDAIYTEPPNKQLYKGRTALFEFFGGEAGRADSMLMEWHHIVYNPSTQTGMAEWTFTYKSSRSHGAIIVKIRNGLIQNWREYFYETSMNWEEFTRDNLF